MIEVMPDIAKAVNSLDSPAAQVCAFRVLVSAANQDLARRCWDNSDPRWEDLLESLDASSLGLRDLLDEEQWLEVNTLLDEAERRDAEQPRSEDAFAQALTADELRRLAALAAQGEPVTLKKT